VIAKKSNDGKLGLVLVDIGNTSVSAATWVDGVRNAADHMGTESVDSLVELLEAKWSELPQDSKRAVAACSVCPELLNQLRSGCGDRDIGPILVVGEELDLPIGVDLSEPDKVGTDRLCAAAGAYMKVKSACVVADFGTALTIDLVADNGVFLGGTIMPGMALAARALHEYTALLPMVEVGATKEILGKDTKSAIKNGIYAMMGGALREVTERYATDIGKWPVLVVTGGDARIVGEAYDFVDRIFDDICLDGLVLAYQQHANQKNQE